MVDFIVSVIGVTSTIICGVVPTIILHFLKKKEIKNDNNRKIKIKIDDETFEIKGHNEEEIKEVLMKFNLQKTDK